MALITPSTPPGTMELLPRQQIVFQRMLDTIRRGFELYGFLPIETPVFELADVLLSKSGGPSLVFNVTVSRSKVRRATLMLSLVATASE